MSLQARKLSLIEYLISLKDERIFNSIEKSVEEVRKQHLKVFSEEDLILRAEEADLDYKKGNFKTQENLENESKNW